MSAPIQNAIGLSGWTVHEIRDTEIMREYHTTCDAQPAACPKCGVVAHLYRHGSKTVRYVDAPSWGKQSLLVVKVQRYRCRSCEATFMQRLPDVDDSRQMTKRCMAYIEQQGIPQTFAALSRHIGVDEKTVRTICNSKFERQFSTRSTRRNSMRELSGSTHNYPDSRNSSHTTRRLRASAELEAALRGVLPYTHADEQRVFLRRGIGTATPSGRAWLAVFAALGEPVKSKK